MPLLPPPDNTKAILTAAVGAAAALVVFALTRSTLPHVGDNIHALPHGGLYRDGTKIISYCSPSKKFPSSNLLSSNVYPIIAIAAIILVIHIIERRRAGCLGCGGNHAR